MKKPKKEQRLASSTFVRKMKNPKFKQLYKDGHNEYKLTIEYTLCGEIINLEEFELKLADKIMELMNGYGMLCGGRINLEQNDGE